MPQLMPMIRGSRCGEVGPVQVFEHQHQRLNLGFGFQQRPNGAEYLVVHLWRLKKLDEIGVVFGHRQVHQSSEERH